MSRLRCRTLAMSTVAEPVMLVPNCAAWRTRCETFALQISFLLGMQLMFGHEPPMYRRSTTAVRRPARAICHASNFPPAPLPRTRISNRSGCDMRFTPYVAASFGTTPMRVCSSSAPCPGLDPRQPVTAGQFLVDTLGATAVDPQIGAVDEARERAGQER